LRAQGQWYARNLVDLFFIMGVDMFAPFGLVPVLAVAQLGVKIKFEVVV
jgi:hypothetical protein